MTQTLPTGEIQTYCACAFCSSILTPMKRSITARTQACLVLLNTCVCSRLMRSQQYRACAVAVSPRRWQPAPVGERSDRRAPGCLELPRVRQGVPLLTTSKCRHRSLGAGAGSYDEERKNFNSRSGAFACYSLLDLLAHFCWPRRLS
jgi:hypothetical protein